MNTILELAFKAGQLKEKIKAIFGMTEEDWQNEIKRIEELKNSPYYCEACKDVNYNHECDCDSCHGKE